MTAIIEQGFWYKARYTPIRDALRGKMTARLDLRRCLDESLLAQPAKEKLLRVVKAARLSRLESVEVLTELIAHFTDGIASGISVDELMNRFGDEYQIAALIRRAKRRNRSMAWRALRLASGAMLALIVCYSSYAVYFFSGRPSPRIDYVDNINRPVLTTQMADRAWPLYRRALIRMDADSHATFATLVNINASPTSKERVEILNVIRRQQAAMEWIRQGATKPTLGWVIGAQGSANDSELWPYNTSVHSESKAGEALLTAALPPLMYLREFAAMLQADGALAREKGDGKRVSEDIGYTLDLSHQTAAKEFANAPLFVSLISLSISGMAIDQVEQTIQERPTLIGSNDWKALAYRLSKPKVAADLISIDAERVWFDDMLQRSFTDDGAGDGRLTSEGAELYLPKLAEKSGWLDRAIQPSVGLIVPSRRVLREEHSRALTVAEANMKLPIRDAHWQSLQDFHSLNRSPISRLVPAYSTAQVYAELMLGRRDGVVTAIALELYHEKNGRYPESLDVLVPNFLEEVPADRITGMPVKYRLVDGRPLVYSVGADRQDDGGVDTVPSGAAANWKVDIKGSPKGDWILYPRVTRGTPVSNLRAK